MQTDSWYRRALAALLNLAVVAGLLAGRAPVAHADEVVIYKVYVTDQRDTGFVLSWTTDVTADGKADWGTSAPLSNHATDPEGAGTVHRVAIPQAGALTAATSYRSQVLSGGSVENNAGDYYDLTTGPTLFPPTPGNTVWGYVYGPDGVTAAANAIVFLRLHNDDGSGSPDASQWVTVRADSGGVWYYGLNNIRTADAAGYFTYDLGIDRVEIIARGGSTGAAELGLVVPTDYPGGAAQLPGIVLADPPDATQPKVRIALIAGNDVQLTWEHTATNTDYEVWQSGDPFAEPRSAETHRVGELERGDPGDTLELTDEDAAGNPADCDFYAVLAYDLGGKPGSASQRVGEFAFALTKGAP
jgi:hypothetical protein